MAKITEFEVKKTKKKSKPEIAKVAKKVLAERKIKREPAKEDLEAVRGKLYNPQGNPELYERVVALEQRIDRIVIAISKAKSVKGL